MRVRDVYINGIGVFLPEVVDVREAIERGLVPPGTGAGLGFTGVAVAGEMPAPEMALRAAQDALKGSGVSPDEIALLLYAAVWQQGPVGWQPQFHLQRYLVGDDALAVQINHGCAGLFSAIELAIGSLRATDENRAALVVAGDNFGTPLMNRCAAGAGLAVVGDGASAVVLTRNPGFARLLSIRTANHSAMEEAWRAGEPMFPPGITVGRETDFVRVHEAFKERVATAEHGLMSILHVQRGVDCVRGALTDAEVEPADITRVICHNMPREDTRNYLGMLGFPLSRSTWEFGSRIGHLGASDQVISLHHLITTGALVPGDHVLLCGLAPGVTYKAAVVQIVDEPPAPG
nr:ketoacyl-ACP synthase III family protein [Micromonospora sp. DSM 115978]